MRPVALLLIACAGASPSLAQSPMPFGKAAQLSRMPLTAAPAPVREAPVALQEENLHPFETRDVRLLWSNRRWQLAHKGEVLKDFGPREQEARQALRILQELHLNQHAVIGSPQPVMEYWLADGKPPQGGAHGGMRTIPLDAGSLRVEEVQGQWCLRDATRVLFNFRHNADDARQALTVVRKYHFDEVGIVGTTAPMYVFLKHSTSELPTLPSTKGPGSSSRHLVVPHFSRAAKNPDGSRRTDPAKAGGLEGVASQAVPPLADPARQADANKPHEFRWRTKPAFGRPATASDDGQRVAFDWRNVQLRQDQGDWKLMAGTTVLGNFGQQAHEARLALAAMRYYRFHEQFRLGGDQAYLTYYVTNRAAPRGVMLGIAGEEVKADKLELRQVETGFALCQGPRVVIKLREREDDGRKLLEAIKRNDCDRVCRIGEPGKEPMTILLRSK